MVYRCRILETSCSPAMVTLKIVLHKKRTLAAPFHERLKQLAGANDTALEPDTQQKNLSSAGIRRRIAPDSSDLYFTRAAGQSVPAAERRMRASSGVRGDGAVAALASVHPTPQAIKKGPGRNFRSGPWCDRSSLQAVATPSAQRPPDSAARRNSPLPP